MSDNKPKPNDTSSEQILYCSFCGKSQHEVLQLIAGPGVFICTECSEVCIDILCDEAPPVLARLREKYKIDAPKAEAELEALGIKPRFKKLRFERRVNHCFYLCPFSEPFNTIYSDHSRPAIEAAGFTVERADEIYGTEPIIEDIWEGINSSEIVVADVSGRNPNVMYEIGMAHTVGRPVLIITQDIDDVPFDLKHYRCIQYSHTPRGCNELEQKISGTLKFLKGKS